MHKNFRDLTGQRFGRLVAESRAPDRILPSGKHCVVWNCICDCGRQTEVLRPHLTGSQSKSCGCLRAELNLVRRRTHGHSSGGRISRAYSCYQSMLTRTSNSNSPEWKHYGGRGITCCDRWKDSFQNFIDDMGEPPAGLSIERDNVNGPYDPDNCRWATATEQQRNTRRNRVITKDGESLCLAQWAERHGLSSRTIRSRISRGWPIEELFSPARKSDKRVK